MELYYAIVNILDYIALHNMRDDECKYLLNIVNDLATIGNVNCLEVADANNCGKCPQWTDIVESFKKQYANGERCV